MSIKRSFCELSEFSVPCAGYKVCVLQALRTRLRCKEVWIEGADRYRNPDQDVPEDYADKRKEYYSTLDQTMDVETFVAEIQKDMREALTHLNKNLPHVGR